jgi:DNA-directed RNA polymerase specialized sigma24 family protein
VSTTNELDALLYAWLSEPEARKAELRFTSYFQAAFPAICRYLRSFRADSAAAQDIAQQALIKLFDCLGAGRRGADERLQEAIAALHPLDFGAVHARQFHSWRTQVMAFRDAANGFRICPGVSQSSDTWKESREEINGRIALLTRQCAQFIRELRTRIEPRLLNLVSPDSLRASFSAAELQPRRPEALESVHRDSIAPEDERFLVRFLQYARGRDGANVDAAVGCAGAVGFLTHIDSVRTCLPALAIPTNGLLYTIARRKLIDRLRAEKVESAQGLENLPDDGADGMLGLLDLEDTRSPKEHRHGTGRSTSFGAGVSVVPEARVETRYQAFIEFLRVPLTRAEGAFAAAAAKGKANKERARVDSLRTKYERLIAVLAALREEPQPTEEEIARREGLTRNQVKYVIEGIREEFKYFFPDLASEARGRRKHEGAES